MSPAAARATAEDELVVLLHGLWCNRLLLRPLARRLRRCGLRVGVFGYASVRRSPAQNAAELAQWLQQRPARRVHFVAHSLGGLVLCHLLSRYGQPPGRIVLLGTPLRGSRSAARLAHSQVGRTLLGASIERGLLGDAPPLPADRDVGVIAGTVNFGLGLVLGGVGGRGDGAVAVGETRAAAVRDQIEVAVSHTGLLFSAVVGRQICSFLRTGTFLH